MARVLAVCISTERGVPKREVAAIELRPAHGIVGDAHAGNWHRQVSLLAKESIETMENLGVALKNGIFAENIVTRGIALKTLPVGTVLRVGSARLQVTQIGKQCHSDCQIKRITGKCVMPTDGIFAIVLTGGRVAPGDEITIEEAAQ